MNPEYLNKITYKEFIAVIAIVAVAFTFSNLSFIWKILHFQVDLEVTYLTLEHYLI